MHGPVDGALNMAFDRAVQLSREDGCAPPTLRLYTWARPTVTLGRFQKLDGVDLDAAAEAGVDVVRRFTGGRGVLHDDEITYSVVAGLDDGVPRGVAASYRYLCTALAEAYRLLGVAAEVTARDAAATSSAACYLQTTRADLALDGAKLAGSAQVWAGSTVLQHGSFTRTRDVEREARVFRLGAGETAKLAEGTADLDAVLGLRVGDAALAAAVVEGFERALGITLVPGTLSALEAERAAGLLGEVRVGDGEGFVAHAAREVLRKSEW